MPDSLAQSIGPRHEVIDIGRADGNRLTWTWNDDEHTRMSAVALRSATPVDPPCLLRSSPARNAATSIFSVLFYTRGDSRHERRWSRDERLGRAFRLRPGAAMPERLLDDHPEILPVILAATPTRSIRLLPEPLRARVPPGHEVLPPFIELLFGAGDGHWLILAAHRASPQRRTQMLDTADRVAPLLP